MSFKKMLFIINYYLWWQYFCITAVLKEDIADSSDLQRADLNWFKSEAFFFQTVWSPFRSVMRLLHREYCLTMWNVSLVFCQMGHLSSPSWPPPCEQTSSSVRAYRKRLRLRPYCCFSSFKYAPTELPALILWSLPPPVLWNHCNLFLMPFVCHCESVRYNSHGPYKWAMFTCNLMQVLNTCIIHLWKILLPVTPQK